MTEYVCKYRKENGRCEKFGGNRICRDDEMRSGFDHDDFLATIEKCEECELQSLYGNRFFKITYGQLADLLDGKVLYAGGEYGTFISMDVDNSE